MADLGPDDPLPSGLVRVAAYVEYDGRDFVGWQFQDGLRSVQGEVEAALSRVAAAPVSVRCAGRTDTGVHAVGQVIHFDTLARRSTRSWVLGANTHLPRDVSLYWAGEVASDFDARFRAIRRRYRYLIMNAPARSPLWAGLSLYEPRPLDAGLMQRAGELFCGQHDFTTFRGRDCQARSPVKTVHRLEVRRHADWVWVDIEAGGFLHNMVRSIVGSLIEVGRGVRDPDWIRDILLARQRSRCGPTVSPGGLYFLGAQYADEFALPPLRTQTLPFPLS